MRMLVTGGAGFIGSQLIPRARRGGWQVTVLDDLSTGCAANLAGLDVDLRVGSVTDPSAVTAAMRGVDAVVHLAAQPSVLRSFIDPARTVATNTLGTYTVLEAMRRLGTGHLVFASSSAVYGDSVPIPTPETAAPAPVSPYGASKLAAEDLVLGYGRSFGLRALVLRLFNVYGPGQHPSPDGEDSLVPALFGAVRRGRALQVDGDGRQSRDFTYVETVLSIVLDAVDRTVFHSGPVNLGLGSPATIAQVVVAVADVTGRVPTIDRRPARIGDIRHSRADGRLLRQLFPGVDGVSLSHGLAETWRWWLRSVPSPGVQVGVLGLEQATQLGGTVPRTE